jgi:hypothetical protein
MTGGLTSTGGSSSGGSGGTCPNATPCGGNVVGTWNVTTSCLKLSGEMDVTLTSLGCSRVPVTGSIQTTGTYTANADGTYTDNTTTKGTVSFPLAPSCLSISSVPVECVKAASIFSSLGWKTNSCVDTNGQCNCTLSTEQQGGIGFVSGLATKSGSYTISGTTLQNDDLKYSYCVSGDTLTVTPQMSALSGTVTLQKGNPGTGGAPGTGGTASTGGGPSTGGSTTGGGGATGGNGGTTGTGGGGGKASTGGAPTTGGAGGNSSTGGSGGGSGGSVGGSTGMKPCDIYGSANAPCIAAHSTVRALYGTYTGNLYQVKRASDSTTKDIPVTASGFADSAQQDTFCMGTTCTILKIYDQSGKGNTLVAQIPGVSLGTGANAHEGKSGQTAATATAESLTVSGNKVYSLYTKSSQAYWNDGSQTGMPKGSAPQGIYMVTSGTHVSDGCCYDYGNGEVSRNYESSVTMDAVYFGKCTIWGSGNGAGPWVMADLEGGIFSGPTSGKNNNLLSHTSKYVTAIHHNNGTSEMSLKAADATTGNLTTYYKGSLPAGKSPMKKDGSVLLGAGGDCCYSNNNASFGTFYEGAITAGYPSDAADNAVQANIVSTGYGK